MLGRCAELLIFGLVPLMFGVFGLPEVSAAEERTIRGEISYRERIALPADAVVTVELADVSLADAPAALVSTQQINDPGNVPIQYEIRFDSSAIRSGMIYALQARITVNNELWFITSTRHDIDPLAVSNANIELTSAK